jgi:hypothetical protein
MRFSSTSSSSSSKSDPIVHSIAPNGHFSLSPTTQEVNLTRSADLSVRAGAPGNVSLGGGVKWELKQSSSREAHTTLSGTIRLESRDHAKHTARWSLLENPLQKTGIPTTVRTVVLLKRCSVQERFQAKVEVEAEVDWVSKLGKMVDKVFGRVERDDPVVFDPGKKGSVEGIDEEKLGEVDLTALSAVLETTLLVDGA